MYPGFPNELTRELARAADPQVRALVDALKEDTDIAEPQEPAAPSDEIALQVEQSEAPIVIAETESPAKEAVLFEPKGVPLPLPMPVFPLPSILNELPRVTEDNAKPKRNARAARLVGAVVAGALGLVGLLAVSDAITGRNALGKTADTVTRGFGEVIAGGKEIVINGMGYAKAGTDALGRGVVSLIETTTQQIEAAKRELFPNQTHTPPTVKSVPTSNEPGDHARPGPGSDLSPYGAPVKGSLMNTLAYRRQHLPNQPKSL